MPAVTMHESQLDSAVDSFESAQIENGCADLAEHLPDKLHPDFINILVELIRVDLEYGWQRGTPSSVDDYLCRFPMLASLSDRIEAICFEEYRQKLQVGLSIDPTEYQSRFKISVEQWPASLRAVVGSRSTDDETNRNEQRPSTFPTPGDLVVGFKVIRELGRGAFARVYLAHQADLSDRPVVLKIATKRFSDAKTLARLQHTNIVPVYSVHRTENWEAVCMPYFGSQTFQDLIQVVRSQPSTPTSGQIVLDTVTGAQQKKQCDDDEHFVRRNRDPHSDLNRGLQSMSELKYVDSILRLAKKVAAGLIHAHERGIVHRDLKPANVLLSDDGEPMLLDFNLSDDHSQNDHIPSEFIGGTLPYMAPEQLRAFQLKSSCSDIRSDLFSFGIILYELFTGQLPFDIRHGKLSDIISSSVQDRLHVPTKLRTHNAAVSPAVEAIVVKLLEPRLSSRYQTALELYEDLDQQINHLPLKHAVEPSLKERAQKWIVRHPRIVSLSGLGAFACFALLLMASLLWMRSEQIAKLQSAESWLKFQDDLRLTQVQIVDASLADRSSLDDALAACKKAMAEFDLGIDQNGSATSRIRHLTSTDHNKLRQDIAELHFLSATVQGIQADFERAPEVRKKKLDDAIQSNQKAIERYAGQNLPASFDHQTKWLIASSSNRFEPDGLLDSSNLDAEPFSLDDVRDMCRCACLLASQRRFREASELWQRASRKSPDNIWVWYGLGNALEQLGESSRAAECYSACIALNSQNFRWYFHRGRMRLKKGEYLLAKEDFLQSLNLQSDQPEALVNLAIAEFELQEFSSAVKSIQQANELGYRDSQGHLVLASAYAKLGDFDNERRIRQQVAKAVPVSINSWIARGVAKAKSNPEGALNDMNSALSLNVHSLEAYESKAHILTELLGRTDEAIDVLSDAVRYFPEQASIRAARGVLFARLGHQQQAREDARLAMELDRSPPVQYQVAGIHALLGKESPSDVQKAVELLSISIQRGYGADLLDKDPDLESIRNAQEFQVLKDAVKIIGSHSHR